MVHSMLNCPWKKNWKVYEKELISALFVSRMVCNMHVFTNNTEFLLKTSDTKCQAVAIYFYPTAAWPAADSRSKTGKAMQEI